MRTTFTTTLVRTGSTCFIPVTIDPKAVFGKLRVPVKVTLNGYTFASTIASYAATGPVIPLRKSNREAARLDGTETLQVTLVEDTSARTVAAPKDLLAALKKQAGALTAWKALSYTHQKEHVDAIEEAKAPETRARRIRKAVQMVGAVTKK